MSLIKGEFRHCWFRMNFHMGYQSVKELATKLEYHTAEMRNVTTGYLMVDREHLYDAENQKILFSNRTVGGIKCLRRK